MNAPMETVFGLLGGLAVFLFGMNMMSEGLQKAAGAKMKSILSMLTSNPVLGVLAARWPPLCCKAPAPPRSWPSASSARAS